VETSRYRPGRPRKLVPARSTAMAGEGKGEGEVKGNADATSPGIYHNPHGQEHDGNRGAVSLSLVRPMHQIGY